MLLVAIRKQFLARNCRLRKSFSTVIMLTTNLCRFSICFLHDRKRNRKVKRSEFVEFDAMFDISRYLSQELSDINITESSHSICRPFQRLFCKECKFLPDHEYSSPRGNNPQMLIYAYFAD